MHPLKALRQRIAEALYLADIQIIVSDLLTTVTISVHPPNGGWLQDSELPGIYIYPRSERITPDGSRSDERSTLIDIVLQAKGGRDDVLDQVDDMQLRVEQVLAATDLLADFVETLRPVGSEIYTNQGEVVFGARRVTFEAQLVANRADPSV